MDPELDSDVKTTLKSGKYGEDFYGYNHPNKFTGKFDENGNYTGKAGYGGYGGYGGYQGGYQGAKGQDQFGRYYRSEDKDKFGRPTFYNGKGGY